MIDSAPRQAQSNPAAMEQAIERAPDVTSSTLRETVDIAVERSLNRQYKTCLLDAGFDPEGVQVLFADTGEPWWVKTGHNVPADIHRPCFEKIGGEPNGRASWG